MHLTCVHCRYEFCQGCYQPFRPTAKDCQKRKCLIRGLHAHHPRYCAFYLRDFTVSELLQFLRVFYQLLLMNFSFYNFVQFNRMPILNRNHPRTPSAHASTRTSLITKCQRRARIWSFTNSLNAAGKFGAIYGFANNVPNLCLHIRVNYTRCSIIIIQHLVT